MNSIFCSTSTNEIVWLTQSWKAFSIDSFMKLFTHIACETFCLTSIGSPMGAPIVKVMGIMAWLPIMVEAIEVWLMRIGGWLWPPMTMFKFAGMGGALEMCDGVGGAVAIWVICGAVVSIPAPGGGAGAIGCIVIGFTFFWIFLGRWWTWPFEFTTVDKHP